MIETRPWSTPGPRRAVGLLFILVAGMLAISAAHIGTPLLTGSSVVPLRAEGGQWLSQAIVPAQPPNGMSVDFSTYPSSAEVQAFCHELAAAYPHLVQVSEIGRSYQGRPVLCIRLAGGQGDPDTRPALQIDGQHHGREPIGQQAALYTAWHLVSGYGSDPLATHLLDTRTVYIVPMVNPDGNEVFLNQYWAQRKNARPTDDDGDGLLDEDPPEGVSGWSVFQVYEVQLDQRWLQRYPGDPFVPGWQRWARRSNLGYFDEASGQLVPQVDNDGDGKINEDPPGGVDLNRNYPAGWENCSDRPDTQIYRGAEPFSEPETRAIRDLFEAHPNIRLAISYHSGDDRLAVPGIPGTGITTDEAMLERIGIKVSALTEAYGYAGTRHQHGSGRADGETRAWLYERGVVPWLVEAYVGRDVAKWRWTDREAGRAWAYYHTGLRFNPPPQGILDVCRRWLGFNLYVLAAVPCPRIGQPDYRPETGTLHVPVFNDGIVPVNAAVRAWVGEVTLPLLALGELGSSGSVVTWRLGQLGEAAAALREGAEVRIQMAAGGPSRQYPAPELTSEWLWDPAGQTGGWAAPPLTLAGPSPGPFRDLGEAFGPGGWDAKEEQWDTDRYHMGRFVREVRVAP